MSPTSTPPAVSVPSSTALARSAGPDFRIVILGGGYAGALAANRLAGKLGRRARVTVIEQRDDLVHRVRLHEVIARGPGKTYPLADLLDRDVWHVRGRAERIDVAERYVELKDGSRESFDHLLIAVGSRPSGAIPGALTHGAAIASPEAALRAHATLEAMSEGGRVVVIGGGLSGVEVATEIAERYPQLRVVLVADAVLPGVSEGARAYAEGVISSLGIELRRERALEIDARGVVLAGGERLDAGLVVWAGGFVPQGPAIACDLARDACGRLLVDEKLQAIGHDRIWVAGDAAAPPPGLDFARMSCALAMPMGAHAADNIVAALRSRHSGEAPRPFRFGFTGQCISLGRKRGLVQMVTPEDRPRDSFISGRMGAIVKELICTFVTGALRVERVFGGAYTWSRKIEARRDVASLSPSAASTSASESASAAASAGA